MDIKITPEMLEEARRKREQDALLNKNVDVQDPGAEGLCLGCE